jgi:hypothetical protein
VSATEGAGWQVYAVPERCEGGLVVLDATGDGRLELVRDGCGRDGRLVTSWNGREFVVR